VLRPALWGAPVLVAVMVVQGCRSESAAPVPSTSTVALSSAAQTFTLPAPPVTDPPSTTTVAPTTTEPPAPPTEPPETAPPETAAPETSPPTETPQKTAASRSRRTTTSAADASEATPPGTDPPGTPRGTDPPATDPPATDPPATDPPATDPPARAAPIAMPGDASAVIGLTNQERTAAGLGPVAANGALHAAAQRESNDMAAHTTMSHTGSDGSTVATRATAAGYSWHTIGENIAVGYTSASGVMSGWMNSAGHRANILNGAFEDIGVAVATGADGRKYWTMVLGA
jgi:uncharacterized protein YkwD